MPVFWKKKHESTSFAPKLRLTLREAFQWTTCIAASGEICFVLSQSDSERRVEELRSFWAFSCSSRLEGCVRKRPKAGANKTTSSLDPGVFHAVLQFSGEVKNEVRFANEGRVLDHKLGGGDRYAAPASPFMQVSDLIFYKAPANPAAAKRPSAHNGEGRARSAQRRRGAANEESSMATRGRECVLLSRLLQCP